MLIFLSAILNAFFIRVSNPAIEAIKLANIQSPDSSKVFDFQLPQSVVQLL